MTARTLGTMMLFVGMIAAIMWFFVLPLVSGTRPTIPI
jgi:hypothetical protein